MATPAEIHQEISNLLTETLDIPPKPGVQALVGWSDQKLSEICEVLYLPKGLKNQTAQKWALYNFYNYYFHGVLDQNSSPHQVIFPILSIMKYDQLDVRGNPMYFFPERKFREEGFFSVSKPTNQTIPTLNSPDKYTLSKYELPTLPTAQESDELLKLYLGVQDQDAKIFYQSVSGMIAKYGTDDNRDQDIKIMRLTEFLALLLFRGIARNSIQLSRAVHKKLIKDHIHNLAGWPIANSYSPPCTSCINGCSTDLDKGNQHASRMFALILNEWQLAGSEMKEGKGLISRIQATILTHTAGNGLGLINMMFICNEILGVTIRILMENSLNSNTSAAWKLIASFVAKYLNKNSIEKTYLWARLINDGYFIEYSAKNHPYLAGVFAGIIDSQQTIGTAKEAEWFKLKRINAEAGYRWGTALVTKISTSEVTPYTEASRAVANLIGQAPVVKPKALVREEEIDPLMGIDIINSDS
ncbi:nucleocapsid [Electric ant rhabdovirus]|uniref:Nucleoprotein n=1 Tax=Electric ant rhabdovirus TaxID=3014874 RepID=A0AA95IZW9_9RHAB|nr:nucleocapsid [Electric ant rhabdovirus]